MFTILPIEIFPHNLKKGDAFLFNEEKHKVTFVHRCINGDTLVRTDKGPAVGYLRFRCNAPKVELMF